MDRLQPLDGDMGIKLRRCERSVTEQLLDAAEVSTTLEQVRRRRVPQAMRTHIGSTWYRANDVMHDSSRGARVQPTASGTQKQRGR
jgi:hypothetical protein